MMWSRRRVLISAAVLVVVGCAGDDTGQTETTISESQPSADGPPAAAEYTTAPCPNPLVEGRPELDLGPEFECGYLTVPQDRSEPAGRTIRLAVARASATSASPQPDPIVYLVGGPGNSGLLSAPSLIEAGWNTDRDVIVLEQRGTLKAEPLLACPELDAHLDIAVTLAPTGPDAVAGESAAVEACRDRLVAEGWDLSTYDSTQNAADVADLRVAMGIDEWNVYGVSYGTDLALQTLRDHPEGIRSVVLDSVVPPQVNLIAEGWPNAATAYRALFDACAEQPACAGAFPELENEFHALVAELTDQPRTITAADPVTGAPVDVVVDGYRLANLVLTQMEPATIADLPALVHGLASGDGGPAAAAILAARPPQGLAGWGLDFGVLCREHAPFTDLEQVVARGRQALPDFPDPVLARVPLLRTPLEDCAVWDVPAAPASVGTAVQSDVPVLLLAGGLDPFTPPTWASMAAEGLSSSQLVDVPTAGHDVMIWEPDCATLLMHAFLGSPGDQLDRSCLDALTIAAFTTG